MMYLRTDASNIGCGSVLYQLAEDENTELPLAFFSHRFNPTERRWSTYEQECFAFVFACKRFANFLLGRRFTIQCDHRNLMWLWTSENAKVQRWRADILSHFNFTVE